MTHQQKARPSKISGKGKQTLVMVNKLEILEWITGVQMRESESPVITNGYAVVTDHKS
ncbi:MAG: hypothetical protein HQL53_07380 [Magnetococcales bacterium]|nr:hypothetical protein [Magnetococcales bacterium]